MEKWIVSAQRSKYEIIAKIGEGAQAIVHRGRDAEGRLVAIKMLRYTGDAGALARFERELMLLRQLPEHNNVVSLVDEHLEADIPFAVLTYVEGVSLASADRPIDWRAAARLLRGIAAGLAHAHAYGVLHRDLKPENVIVTRFDTPVVVDFGAGKQIGDDTITGTAFGTAAYMAPEQLRADCVCTGAVDVYALGVLAFRDLFQNDPRAVADLPTAFSDLLDMMIEPQETDRPTASQVQRALAGMLAASYGQKYALRTLLSLEEFPSSREGVNTDREMGRRLLATLDPTDVPAAIGALRAAVADAPDDAESMGLLALALHEGYYFGVDGIAEEDLREAFALAAGAALHDTAGTVGLLALAKLSWHTGRHQPAVLATSDALHRHPEDPDIQKAYGTACVYAGIGDLVLLLLESVVETRPTDGDALYRLGEALQLAEQHGRAIGVFTRYRSAYPMSGVGYEMDAMCRLALGDVAGAENMLQEQLDRTQDVNRLLHGDVAESLGRPIEARRRWLLGVERFEKSEESSLRARDLLWKAMLAARLGMRDVATTAAQAARERDATNGYSLMRSATVEAMLGNAGEAAHYVAAATNAGFTNAALLRLEEAFYFRDVATDPSYLSARQQMEAAASQVRSLVGRRPAPHL